MDRPSDTHACAMIGMLAAACCLFTGPPLISNAHVSSTTMISQPTITMMATGFGATPKPQKKAAPKKKAKQQQKAANALKTAKAAPKIETGSTTASSRRVEVDLGKGKLVAVILPELEDDPEAAGVDLESLSQDKLVEEYGHLTGAGDIVWPAGLAFSRLLAHCPSFVSNARAVELGSGLGAVGLTAAASGAASVLMTDFDEDVLGLASLGAAENGVEQKVSTARLDWSTGAEAAKTLPGGPFDLVLAADVLYAEENALNIARLLPELLQEEGSKCLIADQKQWPWREMFTKALAEGGLEVAEMDIPGPEEVLLLSVARASGPE